MKTKDYPKQFSIFYVNLDPRQGSEQGGLRPCLILQSSRANQFAKTFLIAPFTSKKIDSTYSHEVLVQANKINGLVKDSKLKMSQMRVIDGSRLNKKIGKLESKYIPSVFQALDVMTDRWGDFRKS